MFMALLAGFVGLLSRYGAGDDIVVGTPVAGRSRTELEGLIGFFVNTLVLRCDAGGDPSFRQLLARVRSVTLGAFAHQELPFEKLVEELQPQRDLSRNPLFQIMFHHISHTDPAPAAPSPSRAVISDRDTAAFDLSVNVWESPSGLRARFEYATDLFEASTIARMAAHYRRLLTAAVADPDLPLSRLGMLEEAEAEELLGAARGPSVELPGTCVHELVDARAAVCPEAVAVAWEGGSVSYGELVGAANALAWRLRAGGVGPEAVVAVLLGRSPELVAALLGVLKAGGAYLPLDPADPPERLHALIAGAGAVAVVTTPESSAHLGATGLPVLDARDGWEPVPGDGRAGAPVSGVGAANLAYVIYTSGSTGTPKGVEVEHASLANLVLWHQRTYGVTPQDRAPLLAPVSFDASVWELWPYLTAGSCLTIPGPQLSTSPGELAAWLASEAVTICFAVTPLAEVLASERLLWATSIRALLTGGDRLHRAPESLPFPLFNHYGPTEATVLATAARVVHDPAHPDAAPPIGRPIANTTAVVLDAHGQMVPAGVAGELHLGGAGLARGYRRRPDLTAERFVEHAVLGRLYRTGDRARLRADGQLEFLGRLDDQIKLRGYRIEPGEVEAVLGSHPDIGEAAVVLEHHPHDRLVAYLVPADASRPPALGELRELAARRLPAWAQPSQMVVLAALPRTRHGKVDRGGCPPPRPSARRTWPTPPPRRRPSRRWRPSGPRSSPSRPSGWTTTSSTWGATPSSP
jgi:amino acid adenylation domain-containing protein